MEKPERDWFIKAAENIDMELTDERRQLLARKGERLYSKFCGLNGEGICAESFAEYHALRGEFIVVTDFLEFLHDALERESDAARIRITQELICRVEALLD
jgi:hypothetical protein